MLPLQTIQTLNVARRLQLVFDRRDSPGISLNQIDSLCRHTSSTDREQCVCAVTEGSQPLGSFAVLLEQRECHQTPHTLICSWIDPK